jgi:hypothetical protein
VCVRIKSKERDLRTSLSQNKIDDLRKEGGFLLPTELDKDLLRLILLKNLSFFLKSCPQRSNNNEKYPEALFET